MKNRTMLSFAAGSAIAVAGLIGGTVAMATDNGSTGSRAVGLSHANVDQANEYVAALAKNLGVSEQTLRDALKTTNLEFLDKAVADGKLTQEQANTIRAKIESGEGPMFGFGARGFGHGGKGGGMAPFVKGGDGLAEFLGIDSATLRTEMQGGKTLAQVAEAHGKSRDDLKAFLTKQNEDRLAEAVSGGKLTQARADEMKAKFAEKIDAMIDGTMPFGGHGGHGGHGMPGGAPSSGTSSGSTTQVQ